MLGIQNDKLVVGAMQWAKVEDIDETVPLSENDLDCLRELRLVLEKHGQLKRFGITLIHSHFPISDDEVLLERVNKRTRTLTITPVKIDEVGSAVDTQWSLDEGAAMLACTVKCYIAPPGHDVDHI